jgi:large subunit ribosomal protein L24
MKIKRNDTVLIIAGKQKGKKGKVIKSFPERDMVVVEGVNIVKRHNKLNTGNRKDPGGIIEKPAPIHVSNVMLIDLNTAKPVRVGYTIDKDGKKWRNGVNKENKIVKKEEKEVKKTKKVTKSKTKKVAKTKTKK